MRKKFTIFLLILIAVISIVYLMQPTSYTAYKECVLSSCTCKCYLRGETPEEKEGKVCGLDCSLYNAYGCEYVGIKCPYNITGCAMTSAINDFFFEEQCAVLRID